MQLRLIEEACILWMANKMLKCVKKSQPHVISQVCIFSSQHSTELNPYTQLPIWHHEEVERHLKFNVYEAASLPLTLLPVSSTVQQPPPPYTPILIAENVGISLATTLSLVSHNNIYCDSTSKQLPGSLLPTPYLHLDIFLTGTLSSTQALPLFVLFKT